MSATSTLDMARSAAAEEATAEAAFFAAGPLAGSRLIRQEVALGLVRELVPASGMIGLNYAPFKDIKADDFVVQLANGTGTRMAPARADDAEAELFQRDDFVPGEFRGRTVDWALKSRYSTSDVNTHRDAIKAAEQLRTGNVPLFITNVTEGFNDRIRQDTVDRRDALDHRINWLIMQSLVEGSVVYNDGKIKFAVDWGRPSAQHRFAPPSGTYAADTHDPVGDIIRIKTHARNTYGVQIREALCSQEYLDSFWTSSKFRMMQNPGGTAPSMSDLPYLVPGWGPDTAVRIVEAATGIKFTVHDTVYRTRVIGSTTFVNNRWLPKDEVIFLPGEEEINAYDETGLGFGKFLTSPHPAGNWTSGWYAWEKDYGQDPWGYAIGTGIKGFPVFPHMDLTYNMKVVLPTVSLTI